MDRRRVTRVSIKSDALEEADEWDALETDGGQAAS